VRIVRERLIPDGPDLESAFDKKMEVTWHSVLRTNIKSSPLYDADSDEDGMNDGTKLFFWGVMIGTVVWMAVV